MTDWFLYLTKREWVKAWVNGGEIPINPAAEYLNEKTSGTQTPDEVMQYRVEGIAPDVYNDLKDAGYGGLQALMVFSGATLIRPDGSRTIVEGWAEAHPEETIILPFSRLCEKRLARAMTDKQGNPKDAIVKIRDPELLLHHISQELGIQGRCEHFSYTRGSHRSHSVKGWNDKHMAEIRFYWPMFPAETKRVSIPPGMAEFVEDEAIPEEDPRALELDFEEYDRVFEPELLRAQPASSPHTTSGT